MLLSSGASGVFRFAGHRPSRQSLHSRSAILAHLGFAIGMLTLLILAACGSGGSSCGGGGGYTSDSLPQLGTLDSCSSGGMGSSAPANATDMITAGMSMTVNGVSITSGIYRIFAAFTPPAQNSAVTISTIVDGGAGSGLSGQSRSYTMTFTGVGTLNNMYCNLQGGTEWWWNYSPSSFTVTSPGTATLAVTYPAFSMSPIHLECQGLDNTSKWTNVDMAAAETP